MAASLATARDSIRADLMARNPNGIVGVGIDPTGDGGTGSLAVFFSDEKMAEKSTLKLGVAAGKVDLRPGKVPLSDLAIFAAVRAGLGRFLSVTSQLFAAVEGSSPPPPPPPPPITLSPLAEIGEVGREAGVLGCFVQLSGGSIGALTVRHLFTDGSAEVRLFNGLRAKEIVGASVSLPAVANVNLADAACFEPVGVTLGTHPKIAGGFLGNRNDLAGLVGKRVRCLSSDATGIVLDTEGAIMYSLPSSSGRSLFDQQVFIANVDRKNPFGKGGDSGSLVVLDETVGTFNIGDAVGLYTWASNLQEYHFVTPFCACMTALGIASIHK